MYPNEYNIISLICAKNKDLFLRQIQRETNLSLRSVQNALKKLENQNILESEIVGKNKFFRINKKKFNSYYSIILSQIFKTQEFLINNILLETFIENISKSNVFAVSIFGSYANNTNNDDSDLDLLIITNKDISLPTHLVPYKIHKIQMTKNEFKKNINTALVTEILKNQIIIKNHSWFCSYLWKWLK